MNTFLKPAIVATTIVAMATHNAWSAETFVIDNSHTSVIFGISHLGYSYTYGRFNEVKGGYVLDRENPEASQFQININAASIDTNDEKRDQHLKSPDFFNVKQFPQISFQSTGITVDETEDGKTYYHIAGKLTIHGVTRDVTLRTEKLDEGKGPYGAYRSGFIHQSKINRSDFGMTNMIPMIGDEVAITVSFEGIRQDAPAP